MQKKTWTDWSWDTWCVLSILGLWPRFIEPKMLSISKIDLPIANLPHSLEDLTILQISDLHWHANFSPAFIQKIINKINALQPDLLIFTGDFLTQSKLENAPGLKKFLNSLNAKIGCFAVLGNHDYESYVTANDQGDYDVENFAQSHHLHKGFRLLFREVKLSKKISPAVQKLKTHDELIDLLQKTPFQLLHNSCKIIPVKQSFLNICGLGEYTLGRCLPQKAFEGYDASYPGLILTHNPDSVPLLLDYPGDIILAGHTHGGQVNLPFLRNKFTRVEQMQHIRGLKKLNGKWVYINRGIGSVMPFRWFSTPELTLIRLKKMV